MCIRDSFYLGVEVGIKSENVAGHLAADLDRFDRVQGAGGRDGSHNITTIDDSGQVTRLSRSLEEVEGYDSENHHQAGCQQPLHPLVVRGNPPCGVRMALDLRRWRRAKPFRIISDQREQQFCRGHVTLLLTEEDAIGVPNPSCLIRYRSRYSLSTPPGRLPAGSRRGPRASCGACLL